MEGPRIPIKHLFLFLLSLLSASHLNARVINIGKGYPVAQIREGIALAKKGDSLYVHKGIYTEGNIIIDKPLSVIGIGYPVIDGQKKFEVVSIKSGHVLFRGFKVTHSGFGTLNDPGAIKVYDSKYVTICDNILEDNFFGIYIQYGKHCVIRNNRLRAFGTEEQQIGNGIHCWKSDSLLITGNTVSGHRDGIYFEFVTNSTISGNYSFGNIRYGLHFMFSNDDSYLNNRFSNNGAGVAVMFTKHVKMYDNIFQENWGDAAYGLMLKEISDAHIRGNTFLRNTTGIYMEGTNRIVVERNKLRSNGWGMKIQASCMDNEIKANNFQGNTFDMSTNGSLVLNTFNGNYWDKYEGYDLNKDAVGDVPYRPLSLFSVIIENNPPTMLLFRSFMVSLLDKTEKMIPSITPDNFIDNTPLMRPLTL